MRALPGVRFRTSKIVATGVSAGGLMSIPMASRYKVFTHAMLLHSRCSPSCTRSIGSAAAAYPRHAAPVERLLFSIAISLSDARWSKFHKSISVTAEGCPDGLLDARRLRRIAVFDISPSQFRARPDAHVLLPCRRSVLSQMGSIGRPIWMSTGIYDVDVMPAYVQSLAAQIKQVCQLHRACPVFSVQCAPP